MLVIDLTVNSKLVHGFYNLLMVLQHSALHDRSIITNYFYSLLPIDLASDVKIHSVGPILGKLSLS
jgi:hypothetical protein